MQVQEHTVHSNNLPQKHLDLNSGARRLDPPDFLWGASGSASWGSEWLFQNSHPIPSTKHISPSRRIEPIGRERQPRVSPDPQGCVESLTQCCVNSASRSWVNIVSSSNSAASSIQHQPRHQQMSQPKHNQCGSVEWFQCRHCDQRAPPNHDKKACKRWVYYCKLCKKRYHRMIDGWHVENSDVCLMAQKELRFK